METPRINRSTDVNVVRQKARIGVSITLWLATAALACAASLTTPNKAASA